jgi:uncharacterized membrane protein YfcA
MAPLPEFLTFAAVGAFAQLVDGALGMAYGVVSAAMLLGLGLPPALASASVHYAETFTCGASGISHLFAGNVRRRLFWSLVIPGVIGAVIGAYVVSHVPAAWMRLVLTPYLWAPASFCCCVMSAAAIAPASTRPAVHRRWGWSRASPMPWVVVAGAHLP